MASKQQKDKKKVQTTNKTEKKPTGSLNSRIRGLVRLLKRELPPDVKKQKKLELKELMRQKAKNAKSETERKFAKKYHRVKFFERRKIIRKVEKIEKKLSTENPEDKEALETELQSLKNDLRYIKYFPLDRPYLSLLAKERTPEVIEQVEEIKKSILEKIASGEINENEPKVEENISDEDIADPQSIGDFNPNLENDSFFVIDKGESNQKSGKKKTIDKDDSINNSNKGKRTFSESNEQQNGNFSTTKKVKKIK